MWMGKDTRAVTAGHWVLLCTERAIAWCLSFPLSRVIFLFARSFFLALDLDFPHSLSFFLSLSLSCAPMWFFLSF